MSHISPNEVNRIIKLLHVSDPLTLKLYENVLNRFENDPREDRDLMIPDNYADKTMGKTAKELLKLPINMLREYRQLSLTELTEFRKAEQRYGMFCGIRREDSGSQSSWEDVNGGRSGGATTLSLDDLRRVKVTRVNYLRSYMKHWERREQRKQYLPAKLYKRRPGESVTNELSCTVSDPCITAKLKSYNPEYILPPLQELLVRHDLACESII